MASAGRLPIRVSESPLDLLHRPVYGRQAAGTSTVMPRPLRHAPFACLLVALAALFVPAAAGALTVDESGGYVHVYDETGQANSVSIYGDATHRYLGDATGSSFNDTTPLTGCSWSGSQLSCPITATRLVLDLGGGTDTVGMSATNVFGQIEVNGGFGDDVLSGNSAANLLDGSSGADTITGGGGADTLLGGEGNDILTGGDGDDSLTGGAGNDTLNGGNNDDTIHQGSVSSGADAIVGGAGVDAADYTARSTALTLSLDGVANDGESCNGIGTCEGDNLDATTEQINSGSGADTIQGNAGATVRAGDGNDVIIEGATPTGGETLDGQAGVDTISYQERTVAVAITLASGAPGGAGCPGLACENDSLSGFEHAVGGSDADVMTGSDFGDIIDAGGGADEILAGDGDDVIDGGEGDDTFLEGSAANGADTINGGPGTDRARYGARSEALTITLDDLANDGAGCGVGTCEGDNVESSIERIEAGAGADHLTGAAGGEIDGGAGNDTFPQGATATGGETLIGGDGADLVDYAGRANGVDVPLGSATPAGESCPGASCENDVLVGFEQARGGAGNDQLTGSTGADMIDGGGGDDVLRGGLGDDALNGGAGLDLYVAESVADGADSITDTTGTASYATRTSAVAVTLDGAANDGARCPGAACEGDAIPTGLIVVTGSGSDAFTGSAGADSFTGGAGNDTVRGGNGADTLNGGVGADTYISEPGVDGADAMQLGTDAMDTVSYAARSTPISADVDGAADDGAAGERDRIVGTSLIHVIGGRGADTITGGPRDDVLEGGPGDDQLLELATSSGSDVLDGGSGIDLLSYAARTAPVTVDLDGTNDDGAVGEHDRALATIEQITGGRGADSLTGSGAANLLTGGAGNDRLRGGSGVDTLVGGAGNDTLHSYDHQRRDIARCGAGRDRLTGDRGDRASSCERLKLLRR